APMTEVGGEAAIYITPEDIQGSAATIVQHLPTLAASRLSNLENAQRFSNQKMIAGYLHNYELARQDFENRQNTTRSRS
ncbi:MAG: glycosyltransferase family 1 protein, partial [Prochlorotrichaceae cyanobacterium]